MNSKASFGCSAPFGITNASHSAKVTSGNLLGSLAGNGAAPHSNCGLYLLMKLYIQTPCNSIATCPARNGSEGEAKLPKVAPNRRRLSMPHLSVVLRNHSKVSSTSGLVAVIFRSPSQRFPPNQLTHMGIHQPGCVGKWPTCTSENFFACFS